MIDTLFAFALLLSSNAATDWPHFQGPDRNGHAPAPAQPLDWDKRPPKVLWRVESGPGYGGASVVGGEVFMLDREVEESDTLRVFDLDTGAELWNASYAAPGRLSFQGTRSVPSVSGDLVFTVGGQGQVTCFSREKQALVWSAHLENDFRGEIPAFGWSGAPLLIDELVIVCPQGEETGLVALDRETGEVVWDTPGIGYSHSSPALVELLGKQQLLMLSTDQSASGRDQAMPTTVTSFDPFSGNVLWTTVTTLTRLPIPYPLQIDSERFFLTGGYRGGSTMMRIKQSDDGYEFEELFHIDRGAQIQQPLRLDDHLYVLVNENWNDRRNRKEGGLLCLSLGGEEVWRTGDQPHFGRGNAVMVGRQLLVQDGSSGVLRLIDPSPEGYKPIGTFDPYEFGDDKDHQIWAPIAISGERALLRSQEALVCVRL